MQAQYLSTHWPAEQSRGPQSTHRDHGRGDSPGTPLMQRYFTGVVAEGFNRRTAIDAQSGVHAGVRLAEGVSEELSCDVQSGVHVGVRLIKRVRQTAMWGAEWRACGGQEICDVGCMRGASQTGLDPRRLARHGPA